VQQELAPIDAQLQTLPPLPLGHCPTCARPWPDAERRAQLAAERDRLLHLRAPLAAELSTLSADRYALERRLHEAAAAQQAAVSWEQLRERAGAALSDAFDAEDLARRQLASAVRATQVSEAVAKAFAPTGVRAQIAKLALERMAAQASAWVGRIAPGWVVQLSLGEAGRQLDAIQLRVGPPSALRSYRACSVGERRRVDVGLCLALRELGARAGASGAGTIWADDLFGNLDAEGSARLAEVLREEAERVCVVVLDPNDHLRSLLGPVQVVQIAGGLEHSTTEGTC
jgi:DNA repair exonuclease SbcCD ATPase subunit